MATGSETRKMSYARLDIPTPRLSCRRSTTLHTISRCVTEVLSLQQKHSRANENSVASKRKQENTYRMEPVDNQKFSVGMVERLTKKVLEDTLKEECYDSSTSAELTQMVTDRIRHAVKDFDMPRYKIVCNVLIGQISQQDLQLASRAVWNSNTDNYACVTYKNASLFAVALVYGVFFE